MVLVPLRHWLAILSVLAGLAMVVWAMRGLLPAPVLQVRPGAASSMVVLAVVVSAWFGADAVVAILGHDVLSMSTGQIGVLVGAGGMGWSLSGLLCGFWKLTGAALRARLRVGLTMVAGGLVAMAWAMAQRDGLALVISWSVASVGMGLVYLDAMNTSFDPDPDQPLLATDAASAVVLVEQVPTAVMMSLAASWVAARPNQSAVMLVVLALIALLGLVVVPRVAPQAAPS